MILNITIDTANAEDLKALKNLLGVEAATVKEESKPEAKDEEPAEEVKKASKKKKKEEPAPEPRVITAAEEAEEGESEEPSLDDVRQALQEKVGAHKDAIREKLSELGATKVGNLDPDKYREMYDYLKSLS